MQEKIAEALRQEGVTSKQEDEMGTGYRECMEYMEEKIQKVKNGEDRWESSEEEEDYDYGQESEEVFYRRKRQNNYFEDIHFKRDPKHALIYTNTDYMQK